MFIGSHEEETPGLLRRIDRALLWFALVLGGTMLSLMTLLSVVNVLVMRKALNAPIRGAEDLTVLGLVVIVAIAIPFGARTGAHIEIEIIEELMPRSLSLKMLTVMKLLAAGVMAVLSWQLWRAGTEATQYGESSPTLIIPYGPFYGLLSISTGIFCVLLLIEFLLLMKKQPLGGINVAPGGVE